MFNVKLLLFATMVALKAAQATPAPALSSNDLVPLKTEVTRFGTVTYYGGGPNASTIEPIASACGAGDLQCGSGHVPSPSPCLGLIGYLAEHGTEEVPASSRSICLSDPTECCVSWRSVVPGLLKSQLVPSAIAAFNGCVGHGFSGATDNTNLNRICTRQCLSNRGSDC
ncbi:hypothetical protein AURDEDRAFT_164192 [Auricularia subglabra TFB-10046 SS5]|nr:hypothetical protein AURDEDRAFT_164192 [Auricularia subglabra TFB-10046 SS5]